MGGEDAEDGLPSSGFGTQTGMARCVSLAGAESCSRPVWKIHRFYLRELLGSALLTFTVLFGIVLIASIYRGIDRAQGGSLVSAVLITFFYAADTFPHLLALSLLFSCVLVFARASQEREMTAMRAAGISPRVPMVAALLVGVLLSLAGSFALHYLIPYAHYYKYRVVAEVTRRLIVNTGLAGDKMSFQGFQMVWGRKDEENHYHDVLILVNRLRGQLRAGRGYHAEEAWLDVRDETLWLNFQNVRDSQGGFLERPSIGFDLSNLAERGRRIEGDRDLQSDQLLGEVFRGAHDNPSGARFTVHRRACFAIMPLLFAPIGFCIGVLSRERGRMTALLLCLIPVIVFYGCVMAAPSLVRKVDWPILAWLPAAVVALGGIPFCWRLLRV